MLAFLQTNTPIVIFNQIVVTLLTVCFLYQVVFFVIGALRGEVAPPKAKKLHRYAFFIAAHNEEAVIANLVRSIKDQDYPSELIEVFVVADACTDNTAQLAREAGAVVYERNDLARKGKSWVMDFGFDRILNEYPDTFEGYFIFDADNVISRDYVSKMNDAFDQGFHVVTSYRNSKNFGSSWISLPTPLGTCARRVSLTTRVISARRPVPSRVRATSSPPVLSRVCTAGSSTR